MYTFLSRCSYKIQNVSINRIALQYFSLQSMSTDSFRCMNKLSEEHQRIRVTFGSFKTFLNKIEQSNTISDEQMKDLQKFMQFIFNYALFHHKKEEILYSRAITETKKSNLSYHSRQIMQVNDEHQDRKQLVADLENVINEYMDNKYTIENIVETGEALVDEEFEHLNEEDQQIYPMIVKDLDQNALEEVSLDIEQLETENKETIEEMETLFDELTKKYRI